MWSPQVWPMHIWPAMSSIPRDHALDSTLAMLREGYEFIWNRCRKFQSDLFLTRIMGRQRSCSTIKASSSVTARCLAGW
jgi:hypothetical protein